MLGVAKKGAMMCSASYLPPSQNLLKSGEVTGLLGER